MSAAVYPRIHGTPPETCTLRTPRFAAKSLLEALFV